MIPTLMLSLLVAACKKEPEAKPTSGKEGGSTATTSLPPNLFVNEAPPDARSVGDVMADAEAKGDVVIHGRLGGRVNPFVDGVAVFLLADLRLEPCNVKHGDGCPTPWDYCCEPKSELMANTATIQIVGPDARPLRTGLQGQSGLEPMAEVTIAGQVAQHDVSGVLVINAQRIYVKPGKG
jgi:hypothetical protein